MRHAPALAPALALALGSALLAPAAAEAALHKYRHRGVTVVNSNNVTPNPDQIPPSTEPFGAVALVDATGPAPLLRKLMLVTNNAATVLVPSLATNIFVSEIARQGPGATSIIHGQPGPVFTGSGSPAAAANIRWGTVTGWTITGTAWCNSSPAIICSLAMRQDEASVDPPLNSEFYDLGTWFFHGTGFTSVPYVTSFNTNAPGNTMRWSRGPRVRDGTLPALSLIGALGLAAGLCLGGAAALRRSR